MALDTIRLEGVSYDYEELEIGLICVASPIFDKHGRPIAAVSISGPAVRMEKPAREHIAHLLRQESVSISKRLAVSSSF